eukprot:COSAG01_NODE_48991_length_376_cov_0.671480_1_plen_113_part_10
MLLSPACPCLLDAVLCGYAPASCRLRRPFDLLMLTMRGVATTGWVSDTPDAPCGPCGSCQPNGSGHQLIPGFDLYTKHRANTYIRQAVKESVRIKKAQAAKGHAVKVLPFFTW